MYVCTLLVGHTHGPGSDGDKKQSLTAAVLVSWTANANAVSDWSGSPETYPVRTPSDRRLHRQPYVCYR